MLLSEEKIRSYACKLEKKFISDFKEEWNPEDIRDVMTNERQYDTNHILAFLLDYSKVPDVSKQYFYYMCVKTFNDVPYVTRDLYLKHFGLDHCGNEMYNSYACRRSNLLIDCNLVEDSFGCKKCKFSDHLIYCTDKRHASYMAFNKKIDKKRFKELIKLSPEELKKVPEYDEKIFDLVNDTMKYLYRLKDDNR